MQRPAFEKIKSYDEFSQYYWYREELKQICKKLKIDYRGTKKELNANIQAYYNNKLIKPVKQKTIKKSACGLTLETKILECGFVFNDYFRNFCKKVTNNINFRFTADMAATLRKVRKEQNNSFTIKNLLDVYYGKSDYAKYDSSSCQWNHFYKDFCNDENNQIYQNKLKAASILWNIVKNQPGKKTYSSSLVKEHELLLRKYIKDKK